MSMTAIPTMHGQLFAEFQTGFDADPVDALIKVLSLG